MDVNTYILLFLLSLSLSSLAQEASQIEQRIFHSMYLEQTITGENPDRAISIYLPPSYATELDRHYPVIYLLHGIAGTDRDWFSPGLGGTHYTTIQQVLDAGISRGAFGEMIVVMPDQQTNWFGSFYTNSSVTGPWEDITVKELVSFIDRNYRSISKAKARGIAGHSMGGYGALSLAMNHPEVFSVVYALSPAIIEFTGDFSLDQPFYRKTAEADSFEALQQSQDLRAMAVVTLAQAFSPNPDAPPFYADLPVIKEKEGVVANKSVCEAWLANSPIQRIPEQLVNLKKLQGIALDIGNQDEFRFLILNSKRFSEQLSHHGISHFFEIYEGDHRNQLMGLHGRFYQHLFPFFWERFAHH